MNPNMFGSTIFWLFLAGAFQLVAAALAVLQGDWTDGAQWVAISALTMYAASREALDETRKEDDSWK